MFDRPSRRRIPTTRWTIFRRARSSDPEVAARAVAQLCEHYQDPVYGYYRDHGAGPDQACDLTQGLFLKLIAHDTFARVDPELGSFRSYLRKAAARHQKDVRIEASAQRRDAGAALLPFDTTDAELRYTVPDAGLDPDQAYDRRWAHAVLDRVFARIHAELVENQKADRWPWLEPLLREPTPQGHLAALAEQTGIIPSSLRAYVTRMRQRAEDYVNAELADLVDLEREGALEREQAQLRRVRPTTPHFTR